MKFFTWLLTVPLALAAPILELGEKAEKIPGKFIVVLKKGSSDSVLDKSIASATKILGRKPHREYNMGRFKGYAISAKATSLLNTIKDLPEIAYIEPDTVIRTQAIVTQQNAPYGLAAISHRTTGQTTYVYDDSAGQGTYAYGIDTGIYTEHNDFGGRATFGKNFAGGADTDENGHGTHTAGTLGGTKFGVAKKTQLIAVKVLDKSGSGSNSNIIAGVQWAVNDMISKGATKKAVANMSLGGFRSGNSLNQAVAAAVSKGLFFAIAAGNSMAPAILFTPASEPTACTVAASDKNDNFASFSNFGPPTDIIAPGVDVESDYIGSPDKTEVLSGTSMSTPHVAGLGAYLLGLEGAMTPAALCKRIQSLSTKGAISGIELLVPGTPNDLAFNGAT